MSDTDHETPPEDSARGPGEDQPAEPQASESDRIAALEAELSEARDRLLRAVAEMENLRKRTQREKEDTARFAITRFARDIVTVSDDLARALDAVPAEARSSGDGLVANLVTGIEMTERHLQQVFERHGVRRFEPTGEKFDPTVHEAMYQVPDPEKPSGTVAQVIEPGYMIGERVLRPARVGVTAGGPSEAPAEPEAEAEVSGVAQPDSPASQSQQNSADPGPIGIKVDRSA